MGKLKLNKVAQDGELFTVFHHTKSHCLGRLLGFAIYIYVHALFLKEFVPTNVWMNDGQSLSAIYIPEGINYSPNLPLSTTVGSSRRDFWNAVSYNRWVISHCSSKLDFHLIGI